MAVTRKVHDISSVGISDASAQAMVNQLGTMLIDQGVMTAWHDSWSIANNRSGYNHYRVLKLVQDGARTYGNTYLIFCGSYDNADSKVRLSVAIATGDWNTSTHTTTGTQYLDYFCNPDNAWIWNSCPRIMYDVYNTTRDRVRLISYKSGNTVVFRWEGLTGPYVIQTAIDTQPSWLNLDKVCAPPFFMITGGAVGNYSNGYRALSWGYPYVLRRMVFPGRTPSGTAYTYFNTRLITSTYLYGGFGSEFSLWGDVIDPSCADYSGLYWAGSIRLPWSDGSAIPISNTPWAPLILNIDMAPPLNFKLPTDFCITTIPSGSRTGAVGDRVEISPTEVWEVLSMVSTSSIPNSMVLMARVV